MERPIYSNDALQRVDHANGHDLERQLALAEQHYAEARGECDKARSEVRELSNRKAVDPRHVSAARGRLEAVTARCRRLRALIDDLEERLDI